MLSKILTATVKTAALPVTAVVDAVTVTPRMVVDDGKKVFKTLTGETLKSISKDLENDRD